MRRKVIAGNWKMNMLPSETISFIEEFAPLVKDTKNEVILCVPYTDLFYALLNAQETNIKIGVQNMHYEEKGAFTGEVSAYQLHLKGIKYCIVGHLERRSIESLKEINLKANACLRNSITPIICIGESKLDKEMRRTSESLKKQLITFLLILSLRRKTCIYFF